MSVITSGLFSKDLMPLIGKWFGGAYAQFPLEYTEIFESRKSEHNFEEDVNYYGTSLAVVKPEGDNVSYDSMAQGFIKRYTNVEYGLGFIISEIAQEDGKSLNLAEMGAKALAMSMRQTKENVAANVLNRAFNSSYTGADGLELCSDVHLLSKGGTFRNELSVAADLSEASIEQACIDIADFKNDAGMRIQVMPKKLVIPPSLQFEAKRILGSDKQNDSANNALNAVKGIFPGGVAVNHFLTDTDAFFIITDCMQGLQHLQRRDLKIKDDTDFDSSNMKFKASERYCFGWTDPRGIFGSPGA